MNVWHGCPRCSRICRCWSTSCVHQCPPVSKAPSDAETIAALRKRVEGLEQRLVLVPTPHEAELIEVDTRRGVTDCSTPIFQRVRNIVEALTRAEARAEKAEREVAAMRGPKEK